MCVLVIRKFAKAIALVLCTAALGHALHDVAPGSTTGHTGTKAGNAENTGNLDLGKLLIPLNYYVGTPLTNEERLNYQLGVTPAKMPQFLLFMPGQRLAKQASSVAGVHKILLPEDGSNPVSGDKLQNAWDKDVKVVIHGLTESANEKWVTILRQNYVEHGKNVLVVDWTELSGCKEELDGCYHEYAVPNTRVVGAALAAYLTHLVNDNYITETNIHIIGFCLGAHVGGVAGAIFSDMTTNKIARITGLNPAGSDFEFNVDTRLRLDASDAICVDVIHTQAGYVNPVITEYGLGITYDAGFLDFYPNWGIHQPGCEDRFGRYLDACSHRRAVEYYILSLISHVYIGTVCKTHLSCGEGPMQYMGRMAQCRYRGSYFVNVTS